MTTGKLFNLSMTIISFIKWDYSSAFTIRLIFIKYFEHSKYYLCLLKKFKLIDEVVSCYEFVTHMKVGTPPFNICY